MTVLLSQQLIDPFFWLALAYLSVPLLGAALVYRSASPDRKAIAWAVGACWFVVSIGTFAYPPGTTAMDVREVMRGMSVWKSFATLAAETCTGFVALVPAYILNTVTGMLWGERIVGCVYAVAVLGVAASVLPREGLPVALVLLVLSPTGLWLSRNACGQDIILYQLAIGWGAIAACDSRPARANLGALVAACGMCWLTQTYYAARVAWFYPLLIAWRSSVFRVGLMYAGVALALAPMFAYSWIYHTPWPISWLPGRFPVVDTGWFGAPSTARLHASLGALVFPSYASAGTWCHPGAQTLPWTALAILPLALWRQPRKASAGLAVAAFSLLPDLLNFQNSARSHRQMMILLPLAYVVSLVRVPWWWVGMVSVECVVRWVWLCLGMATTRGANFFGGMMWP